MPREKSVGAIIFRKENNEIYYLLLHYPAMNRKGGHWDFPKGHVEESETEEQTLRREVKEETGFDFTPENILGVYSLTGLEGGIVLHAVKIIFLGDISKEQGKFFENEISETKWFSPEEIEAMDGKTLRDLDIKIMVKDYFAGKKYPLELLTHTID